MKKISTAIILVVCFFVLSSCVQRQCSIPTFTNFSQAITFIDNCLVDNATNRFVTAFVEPSHSEQMLVNVFNRLNRGHEKGALIALYPGREFPTDELYDHLGGHFKELGCVHIFFNRTNGVWVLRDTFICR